ncbi:unnamed protein product [Prunus armeniaca]|uniref:Uncharacterized protein n=1 Tax=Prunus armeniaca TaxID=36596 RepID=A0A6J5VVK9_PRUAR|nr:unnamed protein product [Prunus armeniaca]
MYGSDADHSNFRAKQLVTHSHTVSLRVYFISHRNPKVPLAPPSSLPFLLPLADSTQRYGWGSFLE